MSTTTATPIAHSGHPAPGGPAAASGYRLRADTTRLEPRAPRSLSLEVLGPHDAVLTEFEERHERPMHLILVSTDLARYAHLHPRLDGVGTWTADLPALDPGAYRLVADTVPVGGPDLVLTLDLVVTGTAEHRRLPEPVDVEEVDDLEVALDLRDSPHGAAVELTVRRSGVAVEPDPYLGARGHLVAIAADDLGYLHVHPADGTVPVSFVIADPVPGRYRLFFDFSVDGRVRTAAFTVDLDGSAAVAGRPEPGGRRR